MKTVYSPLHAGHAGQMELVTSAIVPGFEKPSRAEFIKARVESEKLGPIILPVEHDLAAARRVHRADYIDFLPTVWPQWTEAGFKGSAMPFTWPTRGLRGDVPPKRIDALLGYYSFDGGATFVEGTWTAIKSSYDVALTAAGLVKGGEASAFALCRPPGHHAGAGFMGGYCYINNAAVAAQWFRDQGAARVSILDVDYHHGNGTQEIFYWPRRRAGHQPAWRPDDGVSVLPRPCRRTRRRCGRRLQHQLSDAVRHRLGRLERLARGRLPQACRLCAGHRRRFAGRRHLREGPDQPVQAEDVGLSQDRRAASPGSACRRCSSWRAAMPSRRSASTPSAC